MPTPVEVRAPEGARLLEIEWDDGETTFHRHQVLRAFCPCALCQGHSGPVRWVEGTSSLPDEAFALQSIEPTGGYALRLQWGDGHGSGIYTFEHLQALAELFDQTEEELAGRVFHR
jgi:DUF971 family protein